jgi:Tol biopolymer transport system component
MEMKLLTSSNGFRLRKMPWGRAVCGLLILGFGACATTGSGTGGNDEKPSPTETQAMAEVGGKAKGLIVWSSSRLGNHDLFVMNTDGSNVHPITKGDAVDWFPRFSPDGSRILFTRSKKGWVYERDANADGKWDIYTITPDGQNETKVVDNASWGGWINNDEIVYVRSTAVYRRTLNGGAETLLVDSAKVSALDGALLQQPEMSKDGAFLAITLRGSKRETGVWDLAKKTWARTGEGCQINWAPSGNEIYWVHPTGNGGSRVMHLPMADGKPSKSDSDLDAITLIDIPGRRSHEYFPQLSADGQWLVWGATQRGHDHDVADYEIYLWEVGTNPDKATRLTFHSGNDRWPDIFIPSETPAAPAASAAPSETAAPAKSTETSPAPKTKSKPAKAKKKH